VIVKQELGSLTVDSYRFRPLYLRSQPVSALNAVRAPVAVFDYHFFSQQSDLSRNIDGYLGGPACPEASPFLRLPFGSAVTWIMRAT
jgi:hypothetical protein